MNSRLKKILENNEGRGGQFLDCYNQKVHSDIATTIKINMTFSMALNFIAIVLAIIGTLNPVVGALVHNAGSVLVITNSALLLRWKKQQKR